MNQALPQGYNLNNRYIIQSMIGQGGFGITYKAKDTALGIEVCIKELFISGVNTRGKENRVQTQTGSNFSFEDFVKRFEQEAKQLAQFDHPNIVSVIDLFHENNTVYLVMRFIEGQTLKEYVEEKGALPLAEAKPIMHQLLDAVEAVHEKNMLHRDIKPENILITKGGRLVLIDFGSAREFAEGKTQTQTAILTPGYAPLEQYSIRKQRGSYTDIYAIGATLYFMLTGKKPLSAPDRMDEELKAPHELNNAISSQVSSAIMLAMQMKAADRFQSVAEFRKAMLMLFNDQKISQIEGNELNEKEQFVEQNEKIKPNEVTTEQDRLGAIVLLILALLASLMLLPLCG